MLLLLLLLRFVSVCFSRLLRDGFGVVDVVRFTADAAGTAVKSTATSHTSQCGLLRQPIVAFIETLARTKLANEGSESASKNCFSIFYLFGNFWESRSICHYVPTDLPQSLTTQPTSLAATS